MPTEMKQLDPVWFVVTGWVLNQIFQTCFAGCSHVLRRANQTLTSCVLARFHTALWMKKIQHIKEDRMFENQSEQQKSSVKYK